MEIPQRIKNRTTIQFSNATSSYLSKENKNTNSQDICTIFVAALFTIAKIWKQAKCPLTGEWIMNLWYMYMFVHTHIVFNNKKEWNYAICNNMDEPGGCCAKWSQTEKDRYYMISPICGWHLKKKKVQKWHRTDWGLSEVGCGRWANRWRESKVTK